MSTDLAVILFGLGAACALLLGFVVILGARIESLEREVKDDRRRLEHAERYVNELNRWRRAP